MLDFADDFFDAEVRDDFLIDETMKTVWAAEMEVLQEIAVICNRHGLTWYAGYGTLLGAVRHEGFVPWDDDIDIWMIRDDYMKLLEVMPKELPEEFYIQSSLHDNGYKEYPTFVANSTSISIEPERLRKFHGCPFIVGVDIFPLDFLPRNEAQRRIQKELFLLTRQTTVLLKDSEHIFQNKNEIAEALDAMADFYQCKINKSMIEEKPEALISFLWKKANQLAMAYGEKDGDELVMYLNYMKWEKMVYPKEWFCETVALPFEGFMVPVPKEYDAVLRRTYGDYSIKKKNLSTHGYPGYKSQLELLRKAVQDMEDQIGK